MVNEIFMDKDESLTWNKALQASLEGPGVVEALEKHCSVREADIFAVCHVFSNEFTKRKKLMADSRLLAWTLTCTWSHRPDTLFLLIMPRDRL